MIVLCPIRSVNLRRGRLFCREGARALRTNTIK
uniref:Uncharacterized protein n=1 Tax=Anatid alphaherpesvirus 2 TaxID=3080522 RepID=A0AAU0K781_9ALPH